MVALMRAWCVVALLVSALVQWSQGQGEEDEQGQDFFFVIDQSGSIRDKNEDCEANYEMPCMQVLALFTDRVQQRMAELVGAYETEDTKGIRIGIVMFRCKSDGKEPKVIMEPTGNITEIEEGMRRLRQERSKGLTCSETALTQVNDWVEEHNGERKTSVLYMTDGILQSKDRNPSEEMATTIRETNNTKIFGLSIGKKEKQINAIAKITGDRSLIFDVDDPNALESILDLLTSFIFGDFRAELSTDIDPLDICLGTTPTVEVRGASVRVLTSLECEFETDGIDGLVVMPGYQVNGTEVVWRCDFPESFYSGPNGENVVVNMFSTSGGVRRNIGSPAPFQLGRVPCLDVTEEVESPNCVGQSSAYVISGATLDAFVQSEGSFEAFEFFCKFDIGGKSFTRNTTVQVPAVLSDGFSELRCELPDPTTLMYSDSLDQLESTISAVVDGQDGPPLELGFASRPQVNSLVLRVSLNETEDTIPGTALQSLEIEELTIPSSVKDLTSTACIKAKVDEDFCWRRANESQVSFIGLAVEHAVERAADVESGLRLVCIARQVAGNPAEKSIVYIMGSTLLEAPTGGVACTMPDQFGEPLSDGTMTRDINVDVALLHESSNRLVRVSDILGETSQVKLKPCISVDSSGANFCLGEQVEVLFQSLENVDILPQEESGVQCAFQDTLNNRSVEGFLVLVDEEKGMYSCTTPSLNTSENFGLTFESFQLSSNGIPVKTVDFVTSSSSCVNVKVQNDQNSSFVSAVPTNGNKFDIERCWGSTEASPARVLFTGQTTANIRNFNVSCRVKGGAGVTAIRPGETIDSIPAVFDEELQGFLCNLPAKVFTGVGGRTRDLIISLVTFPPNSLPRNLAKQQLAVRVRTSLTCFDSQVVNAELPGSVLCPGSPLEVVIGGPNVETLLEVLEETAGDQLSFTCEFPGEEGLQTGRITSDKLVACTLPPLASLDSMKVSSVLIAETVRISFADYQVALTAKECINPVFEVDDGALGNQSGRLLQADGDVGPQVPASYCLGDGLSTGISGRTVDFLINRFPDSLLCVWSPLPNLPFSSENITEISTDAIVGDATITCESPRWDPFVEGGVFQGAYDSVQIFINSTGDRVGDPISLAENGVEPQVCVFFDGWGDSVNEEEQGCFRDTVELSFSGRSAQVLNDAPFDFDVSSCFNGSSAAVMCEFDNAGVPGFEPLLREPEVDLNGFAAFSCAAPGWAPDNKDGGNFTDVRMLVCLPDGSVTMVKEEAFSPTAVRPCLYSTVTERACIGTPVELELFGPTLQSFFDWASRSEVIDLDRDLSCISTEGSVLNSSVSYTGNSLSCQVYEDFLPEDEGVLTDSISLLLGDQVILDARPVQVTLERETECTRALGAANCSGDFKGTEIVLSNLAAEGVPASSIICYMEVENEWSNTVAPVVRGDDLICVSELPHETFTVSYLSSELILTEGFVELDNVTCADGIYGPISPREPSSPVLSILLCLLFILLLVIFCIVRKRRQEQEAANPDDFYGIESGLQNDKKEALNAEPHQASAELPAMIYMEGDRVEVKRALSGSKGAESDSPDWHKGSVISRNHEGFYNVALDKMERNSEASAVETKPTVSVSGADMRMPLSDFKPGQRVEAQTKRDRSKWMSARIENVSVNDSYNLSYDDPTIGKVSNVPGDLIRSPRMIFGQGDLVEVQLPETKRYSKAIVQNVNPTEETYSLLLDTSRQHLVSDEAGSENVIGDFSASLVRTFQPDIGEILDITVDETQTRRGRVTDVHHDSQTCDVVFEDESKLADGQGVTKEDELVGGDVPYTKLQRPVFRTNEEVMARLGEPFASEDTGVSGATEKETIWRLGRVIASEQGASLYTVAYEDESLDEETNVSGPRLQLASKEPRDIYADGDRVVVKVEVPRAALRWHRARIATAHSNGTYDIDFLSGPKVDEKDSFVPVSRIRPLDEASVSPEDLELGFEGDESGEMLFRPPPRDHHQSESSKSLQVPQHMRFRKRRPLEYTEHPDNIFDVTLENQDGLGLSLGWTTDSRVIVAGFRDLPNGDWGPVEACGLVGLKDQLIMVNDVNISGESFVVVSQLIKDSPNPIKLRFGRWTDEDAVNLTTPQQIAAAAARQT